MYRLRSLCSLLPLAALLVWTAPASAQMGGGSGMHKDDDPTVAAVRGVVTQYARNMVGAAQEMPEEKYGYKPTDAQMAFGEIVAHIAGSNGFLCSKLSGGSAPAAVQVSHDASKEDMVEALKASFDYCQTALDAVKTSNLTDQVDFFGGRKVSKATILVSLAEDLGDHYSQQAMYLRLNGLLPPSAQRRGMGR